MKHTRRVAPTKLESVNSQCRINTLDSKVFRGETSMENDNKMTSVLRRTLGQPLRYPLRNKKKRVRFDFSVKREYPNVQIFREDCGDFWYTAEEIFAQRQQMRQLFLEVHRLRSARDESVTAWFKSLEKGYYAFITCSTTCEIQNILASTPNVSNLLTTGLERHIIVPVVKDSRIRQQNLYEAVRECQTRSLFKRGQQAKKIREASRTWSTPSKLFARHIAELSILADS